MISKELLSEVLELTSENVFIKEIETRNNDIEYLCNVGGWNLLNIYELAHKCKEWASINSYALESSIHMQPKRSSIAGCQIHWRYETEDLPYVEADTEVEAILKACEWIMENKCGS